MASIETIKGNSVVWNQLLNYSTKTTQGVTCTYLGNGIYELNGTPTSTGIELFGKFKRTSGHTYRSTLEVLSMGNLASFSLGALQEYNGRKSFSGISIIEVQYSVTSNSSCACGIILSEITEVSGVRVRMNVVDLTVLGGEYQKPLNINEYAYNEGTLVDMRVSEIKSVGDNAYNPELGYARVLGGKEYSFDGVGLDGGVSFSATLNGEREEIDVIGYEQWAPQQDGYVWVHSVAKDVCICLVHSYDKPFKPYEQDVKDLSFISELFTNGMRSAGNVYDEIRYNKATQKWEIVKRVGEIDLGGFDWVNSWTNDSTKHPKRSTVSISDAKGSSAANTKANILCNKYISSSIDSAYMNNPNTIGLSSGGQVIIYDETYNKETDIDSFKQSLQGVKLYYELAEPIIEEIEGSENWNLDYLVWDFGTEESIASVPTTPFRGNIKYDFNANDTIRTNKMDINCLEERMILLENEVINNLNIYCGEF